ncbi:hypothetical protein D9615_006980 [Tricholomella constricta]|uniref:Cytochrome P450 n=1 Tax=Tricholomella constricta TaxID=117010 RepID=A0A8H5H8V5_9AGAR|nr:hypothetical protein D9615_006980 [Tricholomella constricta]
MNICWNLIYLGIYSEWKNKVTFEVESLLSNHTNTSPTEPLHKRLSEIPLDAWENEMPALDGVIRETLRLTMSSTAMRRNLQKDILLVGGILRKGDFMAYSMADVHEDPAVYPNPQKFDPERYRQGREEDRKVAFGHLGWGAGRHVCPGSRVAKVEMKAIIALMLLDFEYDVVDARDHVLSKPPAIDKNHYLQGRPAAEPCYIRYRKIDATSL